MKPFTLLKNKIEYIHKTINIPANSAAIVNTIAKKNGSGNILIMMDTRGSNNHKSLSKKR